MRKSWRLVAAISALAASPLLGGCGGGGGGGNGPSPIPPPAPPPTPPPPTSQFDTAEYKASNSATTASALAAYDAGASGSGVKVAVIDTGINPNLPEFAGRIDPASQDVAADRGITDTDGHGTMVSAVIAGNRDGVYMHGVAPLATIVSLNVGDPAGCGPGNDCFLDSAIDEAIDLARTSGARIINLSFGDEEGMTPDIWPAIQRAVDAGLIIIMSAGNGGTANPNGFAVQNIANNGNSGLFIIAGAMDSNRNIASFSDRAGTGAAATWYLTALGVGNATVNEFGQHVTPNGTSFSAPTIAGAAALLAGAFPHLTGAQIVELLLTTADEAGAAGTDAIFGRGILNIARAFQPQGQTTLAGSSKPLSMTSNGTGSGAMGDAMLKGGAGALILDGYTRAYVLDLAKTVRLARQEHPMGQTIASGDVVRSSAASLGPVRVSLTTRRSVAGERGPEDARLEAGREDVRRGKAIAGTMVSKLAGSTKAALGFSQSGRTLAQQLAGQAENAFLVARDPLDRIGFHPLTDTSVGLRHDFGLYALTVTSERGEVPNHEPDPDAALSGYSLHSVALDRSLGPARLNVALSRLKEDETLLGSRLSSLFLRGGSSTSFLDGSASATIGNGWSVFATYRRGWTQVDGSGDLVDRGRLSTSAFAVDLARSGIFRTGDKIAFRVMQPLRVGKGGFDMTVPVAYDHKSGATTYGQRFFNLSPTGREIDYELAYGFGLFGGSLDLNLFIRTDPGHVEAMPRDTGAAIRFTLFN